GGGSKQ
ncbi:3-oxoacyl-[acyl-carrier-protein] reductase FabG, partial [Haemophilus influenzae]